MSDAISIHAPPRGATSRSVLTVALVSAFQFTPLREGRRQERGSGNRQDISIHAPPRGATLLSRTSATATEYFNSRPSARGDARLSELHVYASNHFNSRPSARGDAGALYGYNVFYQPFQFTPLREGRQISGERSARTTAISIHAPPRGATKTLTPRRKRRTISIHAPPRGATTLLVCNRITVEISIHAPPRGATETR